MSGVNAKPRPNDRNRLEHCWTQDAACVWPTFQNGQINLRPTCCNKNCKRVQLVASNNVAISYAKLYLTLSAIHSALQEASSSLASHTRVPFI